MSDKAKPFRSDSTLGKLSPERQEQIAEWILQCPEGDRYQHAVDQLAADGIKISRTAVFDWFRGWRLRQQLSSADSFASQVQDALKALNLGLTTDQLDAAGQLVFTNRALENEDAEEFREMEKLRLAKLTARFKGKIETEKLQLDKDKFAVTTCQTFLKWFADKKAQDIMAAPISNAEKIAQLRQTYFADVDALQASGAVVIPKT